MHAARPTRFALRLRHPGWCPQLIVRVNGRKLIDSTEPARYVELERVWRDGDVVDVELPMRLHLQPLPGASDIAAVMYGPIVLAARMGREGMRSGDDMVASEWSYGEVLQTQAALPQLDLRGGAPLLFRARTRGPTSELELAPFHRIAHERYSLYWKVA